MNLDTGDIAGLITGVKTGAIAQREAKAILRSLGMDDDILTTILSAGVGLAVGGILGSAVDGFFDNLFGD